MSEVKIVVCDLCGMKAKIAASGKHVRGWFELKIVGPWGSSDTNSFDVCHECMNTPVTKEKAKSAVQRLWAKIQGIGKRTEGT